MIHWTRIAGSRAIRALGLETGVGGVGGLDGAGGGGDGGIARIHVQFRRGKTYVYDVGSRDYFDRFIDAPSKGRYYVFVIKQRFDYVNKY
jgi:hypothetical protein